MADGVELVGGLAAVTARHFDALPAAGQCHPEMPGVWFRPR